MNLLAIIIQAIHFDVLPIYRKYTTNYNKELLEYVTEIEGHLVVAYDELDDECFIMMVTDSHTMKFPHDAYTYNRFPYYPQESCYTVVDPVKEASNG